MNKRQILASLNDIANKLDDIKKYKEANTITNIMQKLAQMDNLDKPPFDIPDAPEQQDRDKIHKEIDDLTNGHSALMVIVDLFNEIENMMSQIVDPKAIDILATKNIKTGDEYFDNYYKQLIDAIISSAHNPSDQTKILISFLKNTSKRINIFKKENYELFLVMMMNQVLDFEKNKMTERN
jgi:hypothetical protein